MITLNNELIFGQIVYERVPTLPNCMNRTCDIIQTTGMISKR